MSPPYNTCFFAEQRFPADRSQCTDEQCRRGTTAENNAICLARGWYENEIANITRQPKTNVSRRDTTTVISQLWFNIETTRNVSIEARVNHLFAGKNE